MDYIIFQRDIAHIVSVIAGHCLIGRDAQRFEVLPPDFCRICGAKKKENIEYCLKQDCLFKIGVLSNLSDLSCYDILLLGSFARRSNWFDAGVRSAMIRQCRGITMYLRV